MKVSVELTEVQISMLVQALNATPQGPAGRFLANKLYKARKAAQAAEALTAPREAPTMVLNGRTVEK